MNTMRDYSEFSKIQALQSVFGDQAFVKKNGGKADATESTAKQFESLFLTQMLEQLFPDEEGGEMFGGGEGDSVYRSMMIEQYGSLFTQHGGVGVSDAIQRQLLTYQEARS